MQQLCDLYENNIEELENAYEVEINELRERYQKYDDNNELYVSSVSYTHLDVYKRQHYIYLRNIFMSAAAEWMKRVKKADRQRFLQN